MLEVYMTALWGLFTVYLVWYSTSAKHYAPITVNDARILWLIHKTRTQCSAKKWREVKRAKKVVGFECECGYKHIQRRPIVSSDPTPLVEARTSMLNKLGTSQR